MSSLGPQVAQIPQVPEAYNKPDFDQVVQAIESRFTDIERNTEQIFGLSWTPYTPSLTSGSGSFTTATASGRYRRVGNTLGITVTVTITTNGTAAGSVIAGMPPGIVAAASFVLPTRETGVNGTLGQAIVSGSTITMYTAANGYPGGNAFVLVASGTVEVV